MAKGGRYLKKEEKKKGKGWKTFLIVVLILALLLGGAGVYLYTSANDILDDILSEMNIAQTNKKDVSEEDIMNILGNPQE